MRTCVAPLYKSISGSRLFLTRKKKIEAKTREDSSEDKSESEESGSLELRYMFEIETSALHNIHTISNYQHTVPARRAAHTAMVGMAIHFS